MVLCMFFLILKLYLACNCNIVVVTFSLVSMAKLFINNLGRNCYKKHVWLSSHKNQNLDNLWTHIYHFLINFLKNS